MTHPEPRTEQRLACARRTLEELSAQIAGGADPSDVALAALASGATVMTDACGPAATVTALHSFAVIHGPRPEAKPPSVLTPEQHQRVLDFLSGAHLVHIRNDIAAGASPDIAATASVGAGLNVLADVMTLTEIETLVQKMLDNLRGHQAAERTLN